MAKKLLDVGANPNTGSKRNTPLTLAIKMNDLGMVQALLEAGADTRATNNAGKDAMAIAKENIRSSDFVTLIADARALERATGGARSQPSAPLGGSGIKIPQQTDAESMQAQAAARALASMKERLKEHEQRETASSSGIGTSQEATQTEDHGARSKSACKSPGKIGGKPAISMSGMLANPLR